MSTPAEQLAADEPAPLTKIDRFDGEFDFLPFAAHLEYGPVPEWPTSEDFHLAVSVAFGADDPAAEWRVAAIRYRIANGGKPLDDAALREIARETAARIRRKQMEAA